MTESVRPRVPRSLRALVWDRYIGLDKGSWTCFCGKKIYQMDFEAGHVVAVSKGGPTTVENLRPVCSMCNKSMGSENLFDFIAKIGVANPYLEVINLGKEVGASRRDQHDGVWNFVMVPEDSKPKVPTSVSAVYTALRVAGAVVGPIISTGVRGVCYLWETSVAWARK